MNPAPVCVGCREYEHCRDSFHSWIFFIIGLVSTVSVRMVAIFVGRNDLYAKAAWYIGVIGFFIFFLYKFNVDRARWHLVARTDVLSRIKRHEQLTDTDYAAVGAILCGLSSHKDRINYFFIFLTSVLTLAFAAYVDFIGPLISPAR